MKIRKIISILLVFTLFSTSCLALGITDANRLDECDGLNLTQTQISDISMSLWIAEQDKVNLGMENVDFSSLMLGNEINAYEYTIDGLLKLDFSYIPVYNDKIVALILKYGYGNDAITKQIGTTLVDEINEYISEDSEIAIIYDAKGCYLYDRASIHELCLSDMIVDGRITLSDFATTDLQNSIETTACAPVLSIQPHGVYGIIQNPTHIIPMTWVSQESNNYMNLCWAACMSMMGEYYTGESKSIVEIAQDIYGQDFDQGADYEELIDNYFLIYNMDVACQTDPRIINEEWVRDFIYNDDPLHAGFVLTDIEGYYHSALIYGIAGNGNTIMIRDPSGSSGSSYYGYYDNRYNQIVYTTYDSGYTMMLYFAIYAM